MSVPPRDAKNIATAATMTARRFRHGSLIERVMRLFAGALSVMVLAQLLSRLDAVRRSYVFSSVMRWGVRSTVAF